MYFNGLLQFESSGYNGKKCGFCFTEKLGEMFLHVTEMRPPNKI